MNKEKIIKSLDLATAAYRDIQPYSLHTCTSMINVPSVDQCFLRRDRDVLRITFRGTDRPSEWKTNLEFSEKSIPYDNVNPKIKVHSGFLKSYCAAGMRDVILKSITDDIHYIRISGHSRGAALAVLCAVDIQYNNPGRDIEVVLFGCPRVGNKQFMLSYNKRVNKTVRVENSNDIVTKVPFPFMGFRHVGARLHIGKRRFPLVFSPNDHYPHNYFSALLDEICV